MRLNLPTVDPRVPAVIALGMFDGVHIGHRALLQACVQLAADLNAMPVAHSFLVHPRIVFGQSLSLLTTAEERAAIIASLGVRPNLCPFDESTAALDPEAYIRMLGTRYDLRGIVAGENHRYGRGAKGDSALLHRMADEMGFALRILPAISYDGDCVSSSRIRAALQEGALDTANAMLGMPYFFQGEITPNKKIGTRIGFPTINLDPGPKVVPRYGVYAAGVTFNGPIDTCRAQLPSVCNIGVRPTVANVDRANVETHVLSDIGDRYGQTAIVRLRKRFRGERRFASETELREQIAIDRAAAEHYFRTEGLST